METPKDNLNYEEIVHDLVTGANVKEPEQVKPEVERVKEEGRF